MNNNKLYVGNLVYEATDDQLRDLFAQAGTVVSAQIIRYPDTGRSKGFGFVEMATPEEAQRAAEMFHNQDFLGRSIIVNEARPPQPRTGGGYGGGNGGGNRRFGGGGGRGGDRRGGGGYRPRNDRNDRGNGNDRGNSYGNNDYGQPQGDDMGFE